MSTHDLIQKIGVKMGNDNDEILKPPTEILQVSSQKTMLF